MTYTAPLADMRFALRELAGLQQVAALPGYEHATDDTIDAYPYAVILVSHDRFFLDAVVTRIADLTLRTLTDYVAQLQRLPGRAPRRGSNALRKAKREQDEEVARVKMFIDRFRYQATKASQVQSRIKMLEKVVPIEVPPERKQIHFDFPACAKSGRMVLELKHARKAYGGICVVFDDLNLHIERGDRIALVGPNGVGKSTLMRMLSGEEAPDTGERIARPQRRHAVLRAGRGDAAGSGADGLRDARRRDRRCRWCR